MTKKINKKNYDHQNQSYSGSEIDHDMIEWVPGNQEVRDSSRSGPSEGTVRTNSQSLGKGLGY